MKGAGARQAVTLVFSAPSLQAWQSTVGCLHYRSYSRVYFPIMAHQLHLVLFGDIFTQLATSIRNLYFQDYLLVPKFLSLQSSGISVISERF